MKQENPYQALHFFQVPGDENSNSKKKKVLKCSLTVVRRLGEEGWLGKIRGEVHLTAILFNWPRKQGKEVMCSSHSLFPPNPPAALM